MVILFQKNGTQHTKRAFGQNEMTCIVGLVDKGRVYVGGDSAGVASDLIMARVDPKVFTRDGFIFGFTESFRMGQLIQHNFKIPAPPAAGSCYKYMCTTFMDALIECFSDKKFTRYYNYRISGGTFLVGFRGELFKVHSDFQVEIHNEPYNACGCGQKFALGALHTLNKYKMDPEDKLMAALDAASTFSTGVCRPYIISFV